MFPISSRLAPLTWGSLHPKEVPTPAAPRGSGAGRGVRLVGERGQAAWSSPQPRGSNTFNLEEKRLRPRLDYGAGAGGRTNGGVWG